jgi:hypothetical protein
MQHVTAVTDHSCEAAGVEECMHYVLNDAVPLHGQMTIMHRL